jgi:hypothetical protein
MQMLGKRDQQDGAPYQQPQAPPANAPEEMPPMEEGPTDDLPF